jgi:hypothetical protein
MAAPADMNMKYAVGYQLPDPDEEPFVDIVRDFKDHISEVYFPWLALPSGRSPMTTRDGFVDWSGQARLEADLAAFKQMKIRLNLLLNANCYGRESVSEQFENQICSIISHLDGVAPVDTVTTASLMAAHVIRKNFPKVGVRASVNMRIGTIKGMEYVAEYFDSYCMQREYNRDLTRIEELSQWAKANGKELQILVNSGCLNFCSGQVFHDNLVAHEAEISGTKNIPEFNPCICWQYYADKKHWVAFLQNSWIRPEDIHHYDKWFSIAKLATRMHGNPRRVIQAYAERKFNGNLIDLLEPGHNPLFAPHVIDNSKFPAGWFKQTTSCNKICGHCDYCQNVLAKTLHPV